MSLQYSVPCAGGAAGLLRAGGRLQGGRQQAPRHRRGGRGAARRRRGAPRAGAAHRRFRGIECKGVKICDL